MASPGEEVSTSMTWAYGQALKPYHGWAVRPVFTVRHHSHLFVADLPSARHEGRTISIQLLSCPWRTNG
jgi:hypothetical protein